MYIPQPPTASRGVFVNAKVFLVGRGSGSAGPQSTTTEREVRFADLAILRAHCHNAGPVVATMFEMGANNVKVL